MTVAFVFPGQGSFRAGSLAPWRGHPAAALVEVVADRAGVDPWRLDVDPGTGQRTADAQPAILGTSLVAWQALVDEGLVPDVVAGHSLGEVAATVAAEVLDVGDASVLVAARGRAMAEACRMTPGGMAALVKVSPDAVDVLVGEDPDLVVANDNATGQVVVAGPPEAIERVRERARDAGGRALPLDVEGAFHSPAMAPAVAAVAEVLATIEVRDAVRPLVSGTTATPARSGAVIERGLVDGILAPVRWREVQAALVTMGVEHLVEVGPGGILAGLARRSAPDLQVHTVATPDDVARTVAAVSPAGVR